MGLGNLIVGKEFDLLDLDGTHKRVKFLGVNNSVYKFLNISEKEEFSVPFPYVLQMNLSLVDK